MNTTTNRNTSVWLYTVYFIYFFCGMTLCFEGVFLPEFKEYFHLNYQQQMYTMFTKNIPFLLAFAIGLLMKRIGYKNCLSLAMFLFGAGTLLLIPGLQTGSYNIILVAFFIIGTGFNFELVAGNPLLSGLGPASGSSSRLNLGNALGAIAQIIAPLVLTFIIPVTVVSVQDKLPYMKGLFAVIGILLLLIAVFTFLAGNVDLSQSFKSDESQSARVGMGGIWAYPQVLFGFVTIALVLGAEASLFGLYRNYLEDKLIAGLTSHDSQRMFTLYFAVFALGRLVGSWIQKHIKPALTLVLCGIMALICLGLIVITQGQVAIVAITAIGFFVSIFFPTLYSIAIEGLGELTAPASGFLTMGFLGCALLPVLQGALADKIGLQRSYAMWGISYILVVIYAVWSLRAKRT